MDSRERYCPKTKKEQTITQATQQRIEEIKKLWMYRNGDHLHLNEINKERFRKLLEGIWGAQIEKS